MTVAPRFGWSLLRQQPLAAAGRAFALLLRYFMALFFVAASINKVRNGWAWTDYLHGMFVMRLDEIDPESFGAHFLETYGIPHYHAFGWMVTLGEGAVAIGLTLGLMTRIASLGAMLLMFSFAIGGYYDASLIAKENISSIGADVFAVSTAADRPLAGPGPQSRAALPEQLAVPIAQRYCLQICWQ
jgi:uncharacterized membrane protein YphA (DoxX/SURF4 family)